MTAKSSLALSTLAFFAVLVGCTPGVPPTATPDATPSATPSAPATQGPSPTPTHALSTGEVTSSAQAAALVFASNPRFSSIAPLQPDLIGQSAWYEAIEDADGFRVVVTMGSGDCMAGCIDRRTWTYSVSRGGDVELVSEEGDEIEIPSHPGTDAQATIRVRLVAGPVCPVEGPGSECEPRPVANAEAILRDPTGAEVAREVSDADGVIVLEVPGGAYYVEPAPVDGLLGQAEPAAVAVVGGDSAGLVLAYDTGIR